MTTNANVAQVDGDGTVLDGLYVEGVDDSAILRSGARDELRCTRSCWRAICWGIAPRMTPPSFEGARLPRTVHAGDAVST